MAACVRVLGEPPSALIDSERPQIERNRRVDDVVIVKVGQRREIILGRGPDQY